MGTVSIAVFDIDGVVADVRHRLHHLRPRKHWSAFFADAADDPLLPPGAGLVRELAAAHEIVWLTGRPEGLRSVTRAWLDRHGLPGTDLRMRPEGDYRPARQFKLGVLRALAHRDIAAFVDDDAEVIAAARAAGLPATLADWVPRDAGQDAALREAQERLGRT
jgi:FMN phosphatase YigB (HAD superfamily)